MEILTLLVVHALAAYRVTRLLQRDTFPPALALRSLVVERGPGWLVELWECPWCLGWWITAALALPLFTVSFWVYVELVFAASAIVGLLSERDAEHGDLE